MFCDSNNKDGERVIFVVRNGLELFISSKASNEEQTWKVTDFYYIYSISRCMMVSMSQDAD